MSRSFTLTVLAPASIKDQTTNTPESFIHPPTLTETSTRPSSALKHSLSCLLLSFLSGFCLTSEAQRGFEKLPPALYCNFTGINRPGKVLILPPNINVTNTRQISLRYELCAALRDTFSCAAPASGLLRSAAEQLRCLLSASLCWWRPCLSAAAPHHTVHAPPAEGSD